MNAPDYRIRVANRDEIGLAVDWAAREGWNPGIHDAACYAVPDPEGFLVGTLNGEPIGTISAVRYGKAFAFVGFYIVQADCRGNGYGLRLWNAAIERLDGRTVGLDGVVAQQDNYRKSGFDLAYRNVRWAGPGGSDGPADSTVVPLNSLPFEAVKAYEAPFFPVDRSSFLHAWIEQADATALGLVEDGELAGYGLIRACREGHKIAPLFADGPDRADRLFRALRATVGSDEHIYLDTPEVNPAATALAGRYGLEPMFETARMYRGPAPNLPVDRIFGVTSFEIG